MNRGPSHLKSVCTIASKSEKKVKTTKTKVK